MEPFDAAVHTISLARLQCEAFNSADPDKRPAGWASAGEAHSGGGVREDAVVGVAMGLPFGLWVGGHPVPTRGVCGVVVCPSVRGAGVGRQLMLDHLDAAPEALSVLYGSSRSFYGTAGYAVGGRYEHAVLPIHAVAQAGRAVDGARWVRLDEGDWGGVKNLERDRARDAGFGVERSDYLWARVARNAIRWELREGEQTLAWISFSQKELDGAGFFRLEVKGSGARDVRGWRALARFIGQMGAMCREVELWFGGSCPLLDLVPEFREDTRLIEPFLVRVNRVEEALQARGYPPVPGEVVLRVKDDRMRRNDGTFRVVVDQGRATVTRCFAPPQATVDIRGLASLYTGYATPWNVAQCGMLEGDPDALALLGVWFAGPVPGFAEMF
jgi:predicted acetyltransferase